MPSKTPKRWIVRDANGRIFGPFTTEQVVTQIEKNYFLGAEQVATYPGGTWVSITKTAEFSDRLLDVLDAEIKGKAVGSSRAPPKAEPPRERDVSQPAATANPTPIPRALSAVLSDTQSIHGAGVTDVKAKPPEPDDIELMDLQENDRLQQLKKSRLPLAVIAGAILLLGAFFMFSGGRAGGGERIHLLIPRSAQPELAEAKRQEKFQRARAAFELDTFTGYQRAENELVEVIEGASKAPEDALKKAEALSFLCMTYRELWPFAHQDTRDLKALNVVTQEAKRLDAGGLHGSLCELTNLMANGRYYDASGLADSVLHDKGLVAPILIELRGDLFAQVKSYQDAVGYFAQARSLWPAWQKTAIEEARMQAKLGQYAKALELYHGVLNKVADHGVASVELGLIEAQQFNQYDKALVLLDVGVHQRLSRQTEALGYLGLAQIYMKKQQRARALDAAKRAYELDPSNAEAKELVVSMGGDSKISQGETDLMFLGEQYMRGGDYFSAQAQFKAAFEANPKNAIAAMKAGKCLWQLNQTQDAIDWLRRSFRADPGLIAAYVELADYYAQRYDYMAAIQVLRQAQGQKGAANSYELYRGFANVELRRNNYSGALGYGAKALKLYETDAETLILMAKASLGDQKYPDAQKYAARAIDLDSNNTDALSLYGKIEAGLHGVESGASYIQNLLNRYVINQGQQIPQAAIDLRVTLGEIYMRDERYKPAEEAFRQAVALDPNSRKALVALGRCLQDQGQPSAALEEFLKAAVLDPSDAAPIFYSGQLYADTGKFPEATKQFERVLKINPRYPKAHTEMGRVALKRGDPKRALDEAIQEREVNPELADSYALAAEAYFNLHQYSNCAGEYQKAISKANQNAVTLVRMGRCYRLAGALDSAQSLLRQAISIESGNPDIYKEQGAIFHTKGMADEAVTNYDTYLRLAPNAPDRGEVESRIRRIQGGDMRLEEK